MAGLPGCGEHRIRAAAPRGHDRRTEFACPIVQTNALRCERRIEPSHASDVLSDVLRTIRLSGAMLFLVEASAPWRSHAPETTVFRAARDAVCAALCVVSHRRAGQCWGGLDGEPLQLAVGGRCADRAAATATPTRWPRCPTSAPSYSDADAVAFFRRHGGRRAAVAGDRGAAPARNAPPSSAAFSVATRGHSIRSCGHCRVWIHAQHITQRWRPAVALDGLCVGRIARAPAPAGATCCCA